MRILRLDLGDGIGTVDLHPFISVLHDLDHVQANTLVSTIRSLVNGSGSLVRGLIENEGHLIELGELTNQTIGPLTTEDVIVDADALGVGPIRIEVAQVELDQLRRRAEIDAVKVEEIRADLDPSVAARVFQLQERLRDATGGTSALLQSRLARIAGAIAVVEREPAELTEVPGPIQDLIAGWDAYREAREAASGHLASLQQRVQNAELALAQAMQHVAEAEHRAQPLMLSPEEDYRLEELVNPTDKKRRTRGLSEAEAAEVVTLLAKVDMPTYTSYVLHRLSPTPPAEHVAALEQAIERLAATQHDAEQARACMESDSTVMALDQQFDGVKAEARRHLGPMLPQDLGGALTELVVRVENPAWLDALRSLYELLLIEGVSVPEDIEPEQLVAHAEVWMTEAKAHASRAEAVDPATVEAELAVAERDFDRHARAMARIDQLEAQALASAARLVELEAATSVGNGEGSTRPLIDLLSALCDRLRGQNSRSVPIVVTGEFHAVPDDEIDNLMVQLEALAQQHQLILASNRRPVASWATGVGLRRALRSTPSRVTEA